MKKIPFLSTSIFGKLLWFSNNNPFRVSSILIAVQFFRAFQCWPYSQHVWCDPTWHRVCLLDHRMALSAVCQKRPSSPVPSTVLQGTNRSSLLFKWSSGFSLSQQECPYRAATQLLRYVERCEWMSLWETNTCFTPPPPPPLPKAPKWLCTVAYAALPVRVCSGAYVQFLSLLFLQHYFTTPHTFQWNYLPETWFVLDIHTKYSSSWSYLSQ